MPPGNRHYRRNTETHDSLPKTEQNKPNYLYNTQSIPYTAITLPPLASLLQNMSVNASTHGPGTLTKPAIPTTPTNQLNPQPPSYLAVMDQPTVTDQVSLPTAAVPRNDHLVVMNQAASPAAVSVQRANNMDLSPTISHSTQSSSSSDTSSISFTGRKEQKKARKLFKKMNKFEMEFGSEALARVLVSRR